LSGNRRGRRSRSDAAVNRCFGSALTSDDSTAATTVLFAGLTAAAAIHGGRRRRRRRGRIGNFQVQLDLRSERFPSGDAVHYTGLVLGQLPDGHFIRSEPQVPGRPECGPDAHVTLAAGHPSPGGLSFHSTCAPRANVNVYFYTRIVIPRSRVLQH